MNSWFERTETFEMIGVNTNYYNCSICYISHTCYVQRKVFIINTIIGKKKQISVVFWTQFATIKISCIEFYNGSEGIGKHTNKIADKCGEKLIKIDTNVIKLKNWIKTSIELRLEICLCEIIPSKIKILWLKTTLL